MRDRPQSGTMPNGKPAVSSSGRFMGWNTIYGVDDTSPYMTRIWFGRLRLHIFHRGDEGDDFHDHPWPFWTLPLISYVEEVARCTPYVEGEGDTRKVRAHCKTYGQVVRAFRLHFRTAAHTHRVLGRWRGTATDIRPGRIITLVWRGRENPLGWGFLKERAGKWCRVSWQRYVLEGGKNAPCE